MPTALTRSVQRAPSHVLATFCIVLAAIGFGLVPFFARGLAEAGASPTVIALARYGTTALLLSPLLMRRRHFDPAILWALATGLGVGIGWIGYVEALRHAPVATVGVIYMTYPLFALVAAWVLLRQKPAPRSLAGAGLILGAALLALGPNAAGGTAPIVLLMSIAAPLTFGVGIAVLAGKLHALTPLERVFYTTLGAALGLCPLAIGTDRFSALSLDMPAVMLFFGLAFVTALLPQLLFVMSAPAAGTARTAMAGSVELPVMFVVGLAAFGEQITPMQVGAGALVLIAIMLTPPVAAPAAISPAAPADDEKTDLR